jgi:phospholipase/carboxylesterase
MDEHRDPASGLTVVELEPARDTGRLALVLHGRGASKEDLLDLGEVLARDGFRVVLPDAPLRWGPGFAWYDSSTRARDLPRSRELVTKLVGARSEGAKLSRENVLLCGFSQGGVLSLDVAVHAPERVARVACLSGYLSVEDLPSAARVEPELDVFMGHGTEDDLIPIERARAARQELERRGVRVESREYDMPHTILPEEVEDMRRWLAGSARGS